MDLCLSKLALHDFTHNGGKHPYHQYHLVFGIRHHLHSLLSKIHRISPITINQSTEQIIPPWGVLLVTALFRCLPPKLYWIILVLSIDTESSIHVVVSIVVHCAKRVVTRSFFMGIEPASKLRHCLIPCLIHRHQIQMRSPRSLITSRN